MEKNNNAPRLVCDLDGTLADGAPGLNAAANELLAEFNLPPVSLSQFTGYIGWGARHVVVQLIAHCGLPDGDDAHIDALTKRYMGCYRPTEHAMTYPHVLKALQQLANEGWRISICTQKPIAKTLEMVPALGLDMIEHIVGGGSLPGILKPDPRMLEAAAKPLGEGPIFYLGDSETDAQTAINANVPFIFHENGYCHCPHDQIERIAAFDDFAKLPAILRDLLTQA